MNKVKNKSSGVAAGGGVILKFLEINVIDIKDYPAICSSQFDSYFLDNTILGYKIRVIDIA